ncbi:organic solute transporter Ostalpha-domain-containing protein, partial [Dimargaris cristalligena]
MARVEDQYQTLVHLAAVFSSLATLISLWSMWNHLKLYHQPGLQRWVIRLLWMTPVYALTSWASLQSIDAAYYLDTVRDVYEGFVIYSFFNLLVSYLGGERALLIMLHGRPPTPHMWPVHYWARPMVVGDPYSFLFLKRGILQYVYVKPVLAIITMLLKSNAVYEDGNFALTSGYFWVSFVYNLSVSWCLYCLAIFFMATKEDLQPFRPFPKFLCVKAILFFSFWQSLAISVMVSLGVIQSTDTLTTENLSVFLQDWLICLEMVFAALGHWYSFSHHDFTPTQRISARMQLKYAFRDAVGIKDIIVDSVDTYTGHGFTYRAFDSIESTRPAGERPQMHPGDQNRLMAGMRYTRGGTGKYWLPVDATGERR